MMNWRIAESLIVLIKQVNAKYPKRSKASDGTIGDAKHASRDSDHNPWVKDARGIGVVTAIDITDESANGCDGEDLAALIRASRDPRVKYIIFNSRMARSYAKTVGGITHAAWEWLPYTGSNAHKKHVHISVNAEPEHYDSAAPWKISTCVNA